MDKETTDVEAVMRRVHNFYCDNCEKFLGTRTEYDDGFYDEIGKCEYKIFINNKWFERKSILCESCKQKFENEFIEALGKYNFKCK